MLRKLHGDESLRRIRLREARRKAIINRIASFIMVFFVLVAFLHSVVFAQSIQTSKEADDTNISSDDILVHQSHIEPVETYNVSIYEYSETESEDPYEYMNLIEEQEAEAEAQRLEDEKAKEAAALEYKSSILSKYGWVQQDESGNKNDMTDDLVIYTYELCNQYSINPALVFGMIMVESRGFANSKNKVSGAAGLGQFISSTGKTIYEDFLENGSGSYDHNVTPHDPYTGVTMMITYLNYLYQRHGDTMTVIESYSGNKTYAGTLKYYNNVVSWAGEDIK